MYFQLIYCITILIKVKGLSYSTTPQNPLLLNLLQKNLDIYERVWDEIDYSVTSYGGDVFFIMTNIVITPNQKRTKCPEDHFDLSSMVCGHDAQQYNENVVLKNHSYTKSKNVCRENRISSHKSHGVETGSCVRGDRQTNDTTFSCEIKAWCPVELDVLPNLNKPLIQGTENFTVLIQNSIRFPEFGGSNYLRNNMPNGFCMFEPNNHLTWLCPIFRIGDIVDMAGGISNISNSFFFYIKSIN